jgi:hypothetical protein
VEWGPAAYLANRVVMHGGAYWVSVAPTTASDKPDLTSAVWKRLSYTNSLVPIPQNTQDGYVLTADGTRHTYTWRPAAVMPGATQFKGQVPTAADLAMVVNPRDGDTYSTGSDGHLHVFAHGTWSDLGAAAGAAVPTPATPGDDGKVLVAQAGAGTWTTRDLPLPADTDPLPDGPVAQRGVDTNHFALDDHVHPGATIIKALTSGQTPATNPPGVAPRGGDVWVNTVDHIAWVYSEPVPGGGEWLQVSGAAFQLPSYTAADTGKSLQVDAAGAAVEWHSNYPVRFSKTAPTAADYGEPQIPDGAIWIER